MTRRVFYQQHTATHYSVSNTMHHEDQRQKQVDITGKSREAQLPNVFDTLVTLKP